MFILHIKTYIYERKEYTLDKHKDRLDIRFGLLQRKAYLTRVGRYLHTGLDTLFQ